jgi:tRNA (guanine-N7-)-methyltransferase
LETIAEESLMVFDNIANVYELQSVPDILQIKTYYEKMWLTQGRTIKFIDFAVFR